MVESSETQQQHYWTDSFLNIEKEKNGDSSTQEARVYVLS